MIHTNPAFHPERLFNYSPTYAKMEPLPLDQFADTGDIVCIKTSSVMLKYLLGAWEIFRYNHVFDGSDQERTHTHEQLLELHTQIILAETCEVCASCGSEVIYKCDEHTICEDSMGNIIIYNGCGCGCNGDNGSGQSFGGGQSSGGGASGSWLTEPEIVDSYQVENVTQCDVATTIVPYVMQQAQEFFLYAQNNANNLGDFIDGLAAATVGSFPLIGDFGSQGIDWITDVFDASAAGAFELASDSDFLLEVQVAYIRANGSNGIVSSLDRSNFLNLVQYLPNTWSVSAGIALPKVIMDGFFRIMRMGKINTRLPLATGTAFEPLCNYLYSENNLEYTAPTAGTLPVPNPFGTSLDWYVDLTMIDSLEDIGLEIVNNGSTFIGEFVQGEGLKGLNVGQNNLAVAVPFAAGVNMERIGWELESGGLGGSPQFRPICTYDDISLACQGTPFNCSGLATYYDTNPITSTNAIGWYWNAMQDLTARFGVLKIGFDVPTTMPPGWLPLTV